MEAWQEALQLFESLGQPGSAATVSLEMAWCLVTTGRLEEAVETAQRSLSRLDEDPECQARLLGVSGAAGGLSGRYDPGAGMIDAGLAIAAHVGDDGLLGHLMIDKASHRFAFMEVAEVAELGYEAARLLRSAGALWELANGLGFLAISLVQLGRFKEAAEVDGDLEPLAQRLGHHFALIGFALRARGQRNFYVSGRLDALETFARQDLELCRSAGMPWLTSHSMTWLGLASFWRGDWNVAGERFEEATRLEAPAFLQGFDRGFLILHRTYAGPARDGLAMLDELAAELPRVGQPNTWGSWRLLLSAVEALVIAGQDDRAALLYPAVLDCQKTGVVTAVPDGRLVERVAGIAAAAGRQWEAAEEHFRNALCQADELPHQLEQAETRRFFARMLLERDGPGDRAKATQMAAEAADLYRRRGMPRHIELAAGLLNAS